MAKKDAYEARAEELLTPIAAANGCEVYDVEYVKEAGTWYLRAYIDKEGGFTVDDCEMVSRRLGDSIIDCENVSRAFSDKLDEEDFISDAYILEVSSPGLGRALKKDRHLEKSLGEEVEVRTYKPIDKQKEFTGILKSYDKDTITIQTEEKDLVFAKSDIAIIRLTLDF